MRSIALISALPFSAAGPVDGETTEGLPDRNPGWTEEALQRALDRAAAGDPVRWVGFGNNPLP